MATILKPGQRQFEENHGRPDPYRLFTDLSRTRAGVNPYGLNFDLRQLEPGQYSGAYHFHHHAEELFVVLGGSAILRSPAGLESLCEGDIVFFESGAGGAHQLYNPTGEPFLYLDVRSFHGFDVCEYPDSGKIFLVPSREIYHKGPPAEYLDGEENVAERWRELECEGA